MKWWSRGVLFGIDKVRMQGMEESGFQAETSMSLDAETSDEVYCVFFDTGFKLY